MDYRTLIIFDTNKIRKTLKGRINYLNFGFGGDYPRIVKFINDNNLEKYVHLAIPDSVIDEIRLQMKRDLNNDLEDLKNIQARLTSLRKVSVEDLDDKLNFNDRINKNIKKYLTENGNIKILVTEKEDDIFKNLKNKAFLGILPFNKEGNTGFKDALIWENILHSAIHSAYDRIYFFTDNGKDFIGCDKEFLEKHNKEFQIIADSAELEANLEEKYQNEIEVSEIVKYANTEYFADFLKNEVYEQHTIQTRSGEKEIANFKIINICTRVEKRELSDINEMWYEITSQLLLTAEGQEKEFFAKTTIDGNKLFISLELEEINE